MTEPSPNPSPFAAALARAGAIMVAHDGWETAADFGSPAGELAVCETSVGLTDRSSMGRFELREQRGGQLAQLVGAVAGSVPSPGSAVLAREAWWCPQSADRMTVLCEPETRSDVAGLLEARLAAAPSAAMEDLADRAAALALLGPATRTLLGQVAGVEPVSLAERSFTELLAEGIPVTVLVETAVFAVALVESSRAEELWNVLERAGRPLGLSCVGLDAFHRFSLAERYAHPR